MKNFFDDPSRTLLQPALREWTNEALAKRVGQMISRPKQQEYLDLTGQWERWGEFLEWLHPWQHAYKAVDGVWPPSNVHLLGRASTQDEMDSEIEMLNDAKNAGWKTAFILSPTEAMDITWLADPAEKDRYPSVVDQIIIEPPTEAIHCDECDGKGHYDGEDDSCLVCDAKGRVPLERLLRRYPKFQASLLAQIKEARGKCLECGGCGDDWRDGGVEEYGKCLDCNGTGIAPGPPWVWGGGREEVAP